jgi:repressor of nif and glnA expression
VTSGAHGSAPSGLTGDCLALLAAGQGSLPAATIRRALRSRNGHATWTGRQVRGALYGLENRDLARRDDDGRWRVTGNGRAMLTRRHPEENGPGGE